MSAPAARGRRGLARVLDPRVLLGLAITAVTLWFSFRGVDFGRLGRDIARANLWVLLLPSVPAYVWSIYVRALRWRHLAAGVELIDRSPLFRATAVGFMANNIFPLRIGEVVRAWYLARECRASGTALFGTVILERIIDAVFVLGLAIFVLGAQGAQARGIEPAAVLIPLAILALVPIAFIVALRLAPERLLALASAILDRLLPEATATRLEGVLRQLAEGLAGLRGGRSFLWVVLHSAVLWMVCSVIPFAAALVALDIDLGGTAGLLRGSLSILVWVGAAVALPSAPGFFGPYHVACWVALQPFGVSKEQAVALGTLSHAVFWVTMTGLGLAVLRFRGARLDETLASAEAGAEDPVP